MRRIKDHQGFSGCRGLGDMTLPGVQVFPENKTVIGIVIDNQYFQLLKNHLMFGLRLVRQGLLSENKINPESYALPFFTFQADFFPPPFPQALGKWSFPILFHRISVLSIHPPIQMTIPR
jgi:hypothetical protein